jgi:hypothetical protein
LPLVKQGWLATWLWIAWGTTFRRNINENCYYLQIFVRHFPSFYLHDADAITADAMHPPPSKENPAGD